MEFTTNDHVHLNYTDTGETDRQPVVFIPGIGGSSKMFMDAGELFHQHFRVITLDPRNQGLSEHTYKGQRISRHAIDVRELFTKLDLKNVIAIGNSMGASTFWAYISLYGKSRLAAMVDLDQSPKMVADNTWKYGFKELTWSNYPDYLKLPFGRTTYAHVDDKMFNLARQDNEKKPYDPEENYKCLIEHADQDWRDVIMDTPVPMLVLAGGKSPYFDPQFTQAIQFLNSEIETQIIPECGHLVHAEKPQETYKGVMRFLQEKNLIK